jgi:hypothetical protein
VKTTSDVIGTSQLGAGRTRLTSKPMTEVYESVPSWTCSPGNAGISQCAGMSSDEDHLGKPGRASDSVRRQEGQDQGLTSIDPRPIALLSKNPDVGDGRGSRENADHAEVRTTESGEGRVAHGPHDSPLGT